MVCTYVWAHMVEGWRLTVDTTEKSPFLPHCPSQQIFARSAKQTVPPVLAKAKVHAEKSLSVQNWWRHGLVG